MTNQSRLSSNVKVPLSGLLYSLSLFEHCSLSFSLILSECVLQSPFFSSFLLSTSFHVPGIYSLWTCFLKLITLSLNASLNIYFTFCQCLHVYMFLSKLLLCGYEIWTPTVYILSPVAKYLKAISTWYIADRELLLRVGRHNSGSMISVMNLTESMENLYLSLYSTSSYDLNVYKFAVSFVVCQS